MARSDFGEQILVTNANGVTFDLNKDYSKAIKAAQAAGQDTTQLEREREAKKSSAAYGGDYKTGSESATLGTSYNKNTTVKDRTSTSAPIVEQVVVNPYEGMDLYGSFEDFMKSMGYDSYADQTKKYIQAAVNNAISGYQSQIEDVNQDTKDLARQAYVARMMGEKNLDQTMAASGMAGGMADSQRIGLQANYENNLQALEQQRLDTVKELQRAIENAKLTGDMQAAQELAGFLQQLQGQWGSYVQNMQAMANQNYWNQKEFDASETNNARNLALTMLQGGSMPDASTLTAAGISRTEAQGMLQQVLNNRQPSGGTPTPKYSSTQAETALAAAMQGDTSQNVRTIVEGYYGMPLESVMRAYAQPMDVKTVESKLQELAREGATWDEMRSALDAARGNGWITLQERADLGMKYLA